MWLHFLFNIDVYSVKQGENINKEAVVHAQYMTNTDEFVIHWACR